MRKKIITMILLLICHHSATFAEDNHDHPIHSDGAPTQVPNKNGHVENAKYGKNDGHNRHVINDQHAKHDKHTKHDKHDEHESLKSIGKGKAIENVSEELGFRLSPEAIQTLELEFQEIKVIHKKSFISKKALVVTRDLKGIYRYRENYFKLIPIKILKEEKERYLVQIENLEKGDQIVVSGIGPLRVSDIYSTDNSEYGHSH